VLEQNKKKYTPTQAKSLIAKYCAYQERCHQEVRDKLYSYGLTPDDVELLIYELIQQDFINEERFTLAFVRGKFVYKKWGKNGQKQDCTGVKKEKNIGLLYQERTQRNKYG